MSLKLKVILAAFISMVSITCWSFAEEVQSQAADTAVKTDVSAKPAKTTKVKKAKKHHKHKKAKKEAAVNQ